MNNLLLCESKWKFFLSESRFPLSSNINQDYNTILNDNLDFILDSQLETDRMGFHEYIQKLDAKNFFDKTPLATTSLVKLLGSGCYSAAFLDENGHVFKIGLLGDASDSDFYKKYLNEPSKNFVVHYYSEIPVAKYRIFFIAVTNQFITFRDFLSIRERSCKINSNFEFMPDVFYNFILTASSIKKYYENIQEFYLSLKEHATEDLNKLKAYFVKYFGLDEMEIALLIFEILKNILLGRSDLHLGNLGVDITSGIDSPEFFYFDG